MSQETIIVIRPSFKKMCGDDPCRAAIFNHILYWLSIKAKAQPTGKIQAGEILWYGSTEKLTEDMDHSWEVCKVRKQVNELVKSGLLGRCNNPIWKADRTKHFFFGANQCSVFLDMCRELKICLRCLSLPEDMLQMILSAKASDKKIECYCKKHQMECEKTSDAIAKNIKAIPENTTENTTENTEEKENLTAQMPVGSLCSSSSSFSPNTQEDEPPPPSQLTPTMQQIQAKHPPAAVQPVAQTGQPGKPGRKAKGLSETETDVMEKLDSLQVFAVDLKVRSTRDTIVFFAEQVERGRMTPDDITQVLAHIQETHMLKKPFYGGVMTLAQFKAVFFSILRTLRTSSIAITQQATKDFDPHELPFADFVEWKANNPEAWEKWSRRNAA